MGAPIHAPCQLGGSTNHWAGWCVPLEPHDFEERAWAAHSGWPISFTDLRAYCPHAHQRVEIPDEKWDPTRISAASGRPLVSFPGGRGRNRIYHLSAPLRFGVRYRADLEAAVDTTLYLHANTTNLRLNSRLKRVEQIDCATLDGLSFSARPGRCVLAMGGIENARLLLASNRQIDADVANSSDAVGRYFMEHPHYRTSIALSPASGKDLSLYDRHVIDLPRGGVPTPSEIVCVFSLKPEVLSEAGLLDFLVYKRPAQLPATKTGKLHASTVGSLLEDPTQDHRFIVRAEQSPNPNSRITLSRATDALGMPRVDLNWQIRRDDNARLYRATQILGAEFASAGLGRRWTPRRKNSFAWRLRPRGHHMGTTRMTADPAKGVVDANCRAHTLENLYIAGSSVFTTCAAANPTLTLVALAERLADHLLQLP